MSKLKACPFCGGEAISTRWTKSEELYACEDADCICSEMSWASEKQWQSRPIEDALRAENERLTSIVERLKEDGERLDWDWWAVTAVKNYQFEDGRVTTEYGCRYCGAFGYASKEEIVHKENCTHEQHRQLMAEIESLK